MFVIFFCCCCKIQWFAQPCSATAFTSKERVQLRRIFPTTCEIIMPPTRKISPHCSTNTILENLFGTMTTEACATKKDVWLWLESKHGSADQTSHDTSFDQMGGLAIHLDRKFTVFCYQFLQIVDRYFRLWICTLAKNLTHACTYWKMFKTSFSKIVYRGPSRSCCCGIW